MHSKDSVSAFPGVGSEPMSFLQDYYDISRNYIGASIFMVPVCCKTLSDNQVWRLYLLRAMY
jgi:hypothetical protein